MVLLARAKLAEQQGGWWVWSFEASWPLAAAPTHTPATSQRPSRLGTFRLTHTGSLATVASCKSQVCGLLLFQGLRLLPLEIDFFIRADGFPVSQMVPEPPGAAAHQSSQHGFPEAHRVRIYLQAGEWTPHSTGSNPSSSRNMWFEA